MQLLSYLQFYIRKQEQRHLITVLWRCMLHEHRSALGNWHHSKNKIEVLVKVMHGPGSAYLWPSTELREDSLKEVG